MIKFLKNFSLLSLSFMFILSWGVAYAGGQDYYGNEDPNKKILKQGLLGAGVGAISSSASGGNAGKGALIGAGTNVIGGALLDTLTSNPAPRAQQVQYVQQAPQYVQQAPQYVQPAPQQAYPVQPQAVYPVEQQPMYVQPAPVYYQPAPQEDSTKKILRQGLLGAGVGAISAGASGGKAGQGALIGAGTNVIGGALLDTLTSSGSQPQPVYYQPAPQAYYPNQPMQGYQQSTGANTQQAATNQLKKKIIRKFDSDGNVVSEEEVWI